MFFNPILDQCNEIELLVVCRPMDVSELPPVQGKGSWYTEQKACQQLEKMLFWHNSYFKMFMLLKYIVTSSCALFACLLLHRAYKVEIAASTWSSINLCCQHESKCCGERGKDDMFLCSRACFLGFFLKEKVQKCVLQNHHYFVSL